MVGDNDGVEGVDGERVEDGEPKSQVPDTGDEEEEVEPAVHL